MFTVIIPLYNKEKFIAQAVNSVLEQTFTQLELIVVNDGSTDGSMRILEQINDDRLRVISIPNSGVSTARNTGIQAANYDWIALLDADDWWAKDFLSELFFAIKTYPIYKIFATGRYFILLNGSQRYNNRALPIDGETDICNYFEVLANGLPLVHSSNAVIKRSLFEEKGYFRDGQKQHEDHDLWLRLSIHEKVVFINKPLSFFRKMVQDSASKSMYKADDFSIYLNTMLEVREQLSDADRVYFNKYVNNFVFLTYIKYYWYYTKEGRKTVFQLIKELLKPRKVWVLSIVNAMPFNVYAILKSIKV